MDSHFLFIQKILTDKLRYSVWNHINSFVGSLEVWKVDLDFIKSKKIFKLVSNLYLSMFLGSWSLKIINRQYI